MRAEPDNVLVLLAYARALRLEERSKEAATVLEGTRPSAAGLQGLMDRWAARFRLIEVA